MQQNGSKYFARRTPFDPGAGSKGKYSTLFTTWSCCISNLRESQMQHYGSEYFASRSPSPPTSPDPKGWDQNLFFSGHGHVAYQI